MAIHKIIYPFLVLIILTLTVRCQHEPASEQLKVSVKNKTVKASTTKSLKEKPAVLYRSTDLGETWSSFANGIPAAATVSSIKKSGNKIYVATDYHGIFVSNEGQNNWTPLNEKFLSSLDINCLAVAAENLVIGTLKQGIFVSKDGGRNWQSSYENINAPIRAFFKSGNLMYAGTDTGIFQSTDFGNTWQHVFGQIQILGFTFLNGKIYAATQNGAMMFNGVGEKWTSIYEGDALHDIGNDGTYIYAMTIGQELLKTRNDGLFWENAQDGITRPPNFYTNELCHVGNDVFSAQWIGIYHSQNNGQTWKMLAGLPQNTAFSTLEITDYGILAGISIR